MTDKEKSDLTKLAIKCLNSAFRADPAALYSLIEGRVPCSQTLADDPFIVVDTVPIYGIIEPRHSVGLIGVLAGVFEAMGLPKVAAEYSHEKDADGRKKLVGFATYVGETKT